MNEMMVECFMAATETLNFTTAAEMVHITQPAFSRNIVQLEEEVGFPLFLRSKKNGLRVTSAGLQYYTGLKKLREEYNELIQHTTSISRGELGKLVVGIVAGSCVDSTTMQSIKKFQEQYPSVQVILKCYSVSNLIDAVDRGDCDICFMVEAAALDHPNIICEDVFKIANIMYVPNNLMIEKKDEYSFLDFKDKPFILSEDVPKINELLTNLCREAGFEPTTIMAPDYETKMLWCEMGMGLSVNSEEHYMKNSPNMTTIQIKELEPDWYSIMWNKQNYNPSIALFYSMFCELASS